MAIPSCTCPPSWGSRDNPGRHHSKCATRRYYERYGLPGPCMRRFYMEEAIERARGSIGLAETLRMGPEEEAALLDSSRRRS